MIKILLTQGQVTYVDDVDADLAEVKWYAQRLTDYANNESFMAVRQSPRKGNAYVKQYLHRAILERMLDRELGRKELVDHINHDTLDNQRENLRLASSGENNRHRGLLKSNTSGFKGVHWIIDRQKWRAMITANGRSIYLGTFKNKIDAAKAYDAAAKELHGAFAVLNFPDGV